MLAEISRWLFQLEGFEPILWCAALILSLLFVMQNIISFLIGNGADGVTVWNNRSGDGKAATANFVFGLYKAVPPLKDMFDMAGMGLPEYLGTTAKEVKQ